MTLKEFATLVRKCRGKQQEFFIARRKGYQGDSILEECRVLERAVDKAVAEVLADKGQGLFDRGEG